MLAQSEFIKNVREGVVSVQEKATARLESLNGDARRRLEGLVERGRESQRDLADRLQKLAQSPVIQERVRPAAEGALRRVAGEDYKARVEKIGDEVTRRVKTLQEQASRFAGEAAKERVNVLAGGLRRIAGRLSKASEEVEAAAAEVEQEAARFEQESSDNSAQA